MSWREFAYLLNGLTGESPLGRIVAVRAEDDPEALKEMSADEKRIRNEWRRRKAKQMPTQKADQAIEGFKQAFIKMAQET